MTTLDFAAIGSYAPVGSSGIHRGVATVQLNDDLWRVTRPDGEVLGYVERLTTAAGSRFRAKRLLQRQRRFLPVGDFWTVDDAMDCFKF